MNFTTTPLTPANHILTIELAHLWRSKIVDKCADAERQVLRHLKLAGGNVSAKALLSQKIDRLTKLMEATGGPVRAPKVGPLLDRLRPIALLRSELVHSTLSMAQVEGQRAAILRSSAMELSADGSREILTLARLKETHAKLSRIVNGLRQEARIAEERAGSPLSRG